MTRSFEARSAVRDIAGAALGGVAGAGAAGGGVRRAVTRRGDRLLGVRALRVDIQALRAVAIGTVVLNHVWPGRFTGGFVGVDVFFVISGFLITAHLMRELSQSGRIRFGQFYARRVRRLLPAALFVLLVSAVLVWVFLPFSRWADNALQIVASAAYVENWTLAALSVDYMAHNAAASAVQHYWSLSVEEQFYLVWPLLLVAAAWVGHRLVPKASLVRRVLFVVGLVAVASFVASVVFTVQSPAQAYFVTFTRAWQFAVGALVAVTIRYVVATPIALVMAACGYGAIGACALLYSASTPYPGWAALVPTVATALVIAAGTNRRTPLPVFDSIARIRPIAWLGEMSYSLYLWHWPVLVILPFIIGAELTTATKLIAITVSLVLAWLTRRLIELPAQHAKPWKTPRRSFAGMAMMMVVVTAASALVAFAGQRQVDAMTSAPTSTQTCETGVALGSSNPACDPALTVANPVMVPDNAYFALAPECGDYISDLAMDDRKTTRICDFSAGDEHAKKVWLVGDSHAEQWQAAIFALAKEKRWRLTISTFAGCPVADVAFVGFVSRWGPTDYNRCRNWVSALTDRVVADAPDYIFTSMAARKAVVDDGTGRDHDTQFIEGLHRTWDRFTEAGATVFSILDLPFNGEVRSQDCLIHQPASPLACAVSRSIAMTSDPIDLATRESRHHVVRVDMVDYFCDKESCYAAVGGVPIYFDADHISKAYSTLLAPAFATAVRESLSTGVSAG